MESNVGDFVGANVGLAVGITVELADGGGVGANLSKIMKYN